MSEVRRGEWTSPEKQKDEEYQAKMKNFFAPETAREQTSKNGTLRHPLKDDTAVIPPVSFPNGAAHGRAQGGVLGPPAGEAEPNSRGRQILAFVLLTAAALFVLTLAYWFVFARGGGEDAKSGSSEPTQVLSVDGIEPRETNLVFEKPVEGEDGSYSVRLGEYEWEGTKELKGDVEEVVLEGRTAANFTTAVRLTHGQITTGVFGRAEPDKPMWHATFQRTTTNGEESTNGTYQAVDEGQVILEGAYFDRVVEDNPGDEPDVIVRTYVEGDPRREGSDLTRYARAYRAPEGTPILWLPGWEEPDPVPETTP